MKISAKYLLVGLATLTLTMPAWAHTYRQNLAVNKDTAMGSQQLKPGSYQLEFDDNKMELTIFQKGKVVATVPGQWAKIPQKAKISQVDSDGDKITQVQFSGSDQVFQLQ
jgi:predicted metal-binding membrane protein